MAVGTTVVSGCVGAVDGASGTGFWVEGYAECRADVFEGIEDGVVTVDTKSGEAGAVYPMCGITL